MDGWLTILVVFNIKNIKIYSTLSTDFRGLTIVLLHEDLTDFVTHIP